MPRGTKFSGVNGDKENFPWSADHLNRIGNLPVVLYSRAISYTKYTVVACTLNYRLL